MIKDYFEIIYQLKITGPELTSSIHLRLYFALLNVANNPTQLTKSSMGEVIPSNYIDIISTAGALVVITVKYIFPVRFSSRDYSSGIKAEPRPTRFLLCKIFVRPTKLLFCKIIVRPTKLRNDKVRFSKYETGKNCPKNFSLFVCSSVQPEAGHNGQKHAGHDDFNRLELFSWFLCTGRHFEYLISA